MGPVTGSAVAELNLAATNISVPPAISHQSISGVFDLIRAAFAKLNAVESFVRR